MSSLYKDDVLVHTTITVKPDQLNENIRMNLENNARKEFEGMCYGKYGFICKVHDVYDFKTGDIRAESFTGSCVVKVVLRCKVCLPIIHDIVYARVKDLTKALMILENGPLKCTVRTNMMNDNFKYDNNKRLKYKDGDEFKAVKIGDVMKVTIKNNMINDRGRCMQALCDLESVANKEEKELFEKQIKDFE